MKTYISSLLIFGGYAASCAGQSCATSGLDGNNACIQPTDGSFNTPAMPVVAFYFDPCTVSNAQIMIQYTNTAAGSFNHTAGMYSSGDSSAGGEWQVDWAQNLMDPDQDYEGGSAVYTRTPYKDGSPASYAFTISGLNPSLSTLRTFMQTNNAPWWFGHALSQESSNRQFNAASGNPIFGPPDGFGVAQLDGTSNPGLLRDDDLWAWTEILSTVSCWRTASSSLSMTT